MLLATFLSPQHIALIGASQEKQKVGHAIAERLRHFDGRVSYVNQKGYFLFGKKCVPKITDIVGDIDVAVIATPARTVPLLLEDCAHKKIYHIIILSAGFSESGQDRLSRQVQDIIARERLEILGPNCFGLVNTRNHLDVTYAKTFPLAGSVAFVAQSGALWSALVECSAAQHLGFSWYLSLGDMFGVNFLDALHYAAQDPHTNVVCCYIETLRDQGRTFMRAVQTLRKPVVVLKGGVSVAGARASLSHTGSLAGDAAVYAAAFSQCGAVQVSTVTELVDVAQFLSWQRKPQGKRVLIVSNAGGPSIICADLLEKYGLDVVHLPLSLDLSQLPANWSHNNPIDIVGDATPERFKYTFRQLAQKLFFDTILVVYTPQQMGQAHLVAREICSFYKKTKIPTITCFMGHKSMAEAHAVFFGARIPCFFEIERAVRILAALF